MNKKLILNSLIFNGGQGSGNFSPGQGRGVGKPGSSGGKGSSKVSDSKVADKIMSTTKGLGKLADKTMDDALKIKDSNNKSRQSKISDAVKISDAAEKIQSLFDNASTEKFSSYVQIQPILTSLENLKSSVSKDSQKSVDKLISEVTDILNKKMKDRDILSPWKKF